MIRRNLNKLTSSGRERNEQADFDYENMPERSLDELRTDITEVLGEHPSIFIGRHRKKADAIEDKIETAEAATASPGTRQVFLEYRKDRIKVKKERILEKIANSPDTFLSRQINRQRRQRVEALGRKQGYLATDRAKLERKRKEKPEKLQKQIDTLIRKKIDAEHRKAARKTMKEENGIGLLNPVMRAKYLAEITPEQKQKIVRESILQVRKRNIERGILDAEHEVDDAANTRKIGEEYGRTTE